LMRDASGGIRVFGRRPDVKKNRERIKPIMRQPSTRQRGQERAASDIVGMLIAAVDQDHYTELLAWDEPDIGRAVVEPARLVYDHRPAEVVDLPGQRLRDVLVDAEDATLRRCHCAA